jgi:hypothetical protein
MTIGGGGRDHPATATSEVDETAADHAIDPTEIGIEIESETGTEGRIDRMATAETEIEAETSILEVQRGQILARFNTYTSQINRPPKSDPTDAHGHARL